MMTRFSFLAVNLAMVGFQPAIAQLSAERITVGPTGFSNPVHAVVAPGDPTTLFVVQQGGVIRTIDSRSPLATPRAFMELTDANYLSVVNETGLLALAFHPQYQSNGLLYAYYTANNGTEFRVDQFFAPGGTLEIGKRRNVITVPSPTETSLKHAGAWIGFSPLGGTQLYITTGDGPYVLTADGGDPENNAQNTDSLLGKVLRIDVGSDGLDFDDLASTYSIPAGNMTVNPNGNLTNPATPSLLVRPEIYAYGLRNPWRASFDRMTGDFYIGDVGQRAREEINFIPSGFANSSVLDENPASANGFNFGWRLREGTIATPGVGSDEIRNDNVAPIFDYERSGVSGDLPFYGSSVTGGYVYRGPSLDDHGADLFGTYIFADFQSGQIGSFRFDPDTGLLSDLRNRTNEIMLGLPGVNPLPRISSFAEDGDGNLFMLSYFTGDVYRITAVPEPSGYGLVISGAIAVCWWSRQRLKRPSAIDA